MENRPVALGLFVASLSCEGGRSFALPSFIYAVARRTWRRARVRIVTCWWLYCLVY